MSALAATGIVTGGCSQQNTSGSSTVVIRTPGDHTARRAELQALTEESLIKYVEGKPLTQEDLDKLQKAKPIAQGMIDYNPSSYTAHLVLGQIQLALGERNLALRSMIQSVMNAPPPDRRGPDDKFVIAETLNDIGNIYYGKDHLNEAESAVKEALKISPDNIKYLGNLVQILQRAGREEEAKQNLEKIRKLKPDSETVKALEQLFVPAAPKQ